MRMALVSGIGRLLLSREEAKRPSALRGNLASRPLYTFDCGQHSTRAMMRVQRSRRWSPQRKSRAMNPAFLLCDDLQAH